jgi:ribosomal protein L11 methyltransferase
LAETAARTWPALDLSVCAGARPDPQLADRLALTLDDLPVLAVEDDGRGRWRVYLADGAARESALGALRAALGPVVDLEPVDVPDEGWALKVQRALGSVRAGRIVVAPPWEAEGPVAGPGDVRVEIEPSMGFGTGHHQSTRLCLLLLQALPVEGRRVLDVGTGSGVLAIAAAKLGAAEVAALDHDDDAVRAARENAARNGVRLSVALADLESVAVPPADIVLANLTALTLRRFRDRLVGLVAGSGVLVASGFTVDQVPLVEESLAPLAVTGRVEEDDWVALTLRRP